MTTVYRKSALYFLLLTAVFFFNLLPEHVYAALSYPHWQANFIDCSSCHTKFPSSDRDIIPPWGEHTPQNIDDTKSNNTCWGCHNDILAPYVKTHSSLQTDNGYGDWTVQCIVCHNQHSQGQARRYGSASYLYEGNSTGITADSLTMTGAGWGENTWAGLYLVPNKTDVNYGYKIVNNSSETLTVQGPIDLTHVTVGDTFFIAYGKLVNSIIRLDEITGAVPAKSGDKNVRFFNATGPNSFADGDATHDGVCEVCHTKTSYFRNDGSGSEHFGAVAGTACTVCHSHANGFAHGGGNGVGCDECHGHDAGYGGVIGGKGSYQSHSTHTENDADDVKGPTLACDVCHDTNNFPAFADGETTLATTTVCDTCHSPGGSYDGVNDPTIGAKAVWHSGAYVATDDSTLQSGKEKWCATCHDESPSVISGISAPNVIGDEDGAYTYGTGWGYYKTGHGLDSAESYPASGGVFLGGGKECNDCHDYSTAHIDGKARSFDCTDADPSNDVDQNDRDCDSDEYRQGYRLKLVNDLNPMEIPLNGSTPNQDNYRLCFSNNGCHMPDKYMIKSTEYGTTFRDDLDWAPTAPDPAPVNAHEYHLGMQYRFRSDWRSTTGKSTITCINCHNVHGSTQLSMIRDGKLTGKEPGMKIFYTDMVVGTPSVSYVTTRDVVEPSQPVSLTDSTGTFWDANTSDNLCADCHGNATGGGTIYPRTSNPIPQEPPTLAWTGETGYTVDGVTPDSAQSGDYFFFRVKYTDGNQDLPTIIQVWVDINDNGSYEVSEKFDLFDVDDSDHDSSDGKLYTRIMAINNAGDGTLSYRFYAMDRNGAATGNPVAGATISLNQSIPILAWSGEQGYSADGVNPSSGASASSFVFRIDYSHADNLPPTNIQVWVDVDDSGSYEPGEKYEMTEDNVSDTNFTDGKLYSRTEVLSYAGDGSLNYRFYASDDTNNAIGTPTVNRSVTVTNGNTAPVLAWTGASNYTADGVDPDTGFDNTDFTFQVQYSDADNTPPSAIQLWLDMNDDDDYDDSGEKIDLNPVDTADTDYSDGNLYTATRSLAAVGDGLINYRFFASDGTVDATGTPTNDSTVTLVVNAIKVSCDGTGDYDYTSLQTAIDNAANGDTVLLASGTCTENIIIDNKDLTIVSSGGANSTIIDGNASGSVVTIQNGADIILKGLTLQNGNKIDSGQGGGIYISDSSPTIVNSIITNNIGNSGGGGIYVSGATSTVTLSDTIISTNTTGSGHHGGGIYLDSGTSAYISGSTINDNEADRSGGGIYMNTSVDASLTISNSTISGNFGTNFAYGGGIHCKATGGTVSVNINASTISGSSAKHGGGMYVENAGATYFTGSITDSTFSSNVSSVTGGGALQLLALNSMTIRGSIFTGNDGRTGGGGIRVVNGAGNTFIMTDSSIRDNSSSYFGKGGGLRISGGTATIERSFFTGNSSQYGGGVYVDGNATATFTNCNLTGNKADYTGGGFGFSGENAVLAADIINCTISGNNTANSGGAVEVAFDATATVTLKNSILYGNGSSSQIHGSVTASYSDIGEGGYSGNNNINIDPYFIDPRPSSFAPTSEGDYHLPNHSAAVDVGTSAGAPVVDIESNIRPNGAGVDMGAYEVSTVFNRSPVLEWTGATGYGTDGVDPDQGVSGAGFEFRVAYLDADNNAPVVIELWVDENDNGSYEAGEKYAMSAVDGGDTIYTDGKLYTKSLNLVYAGDDVLNYRFYARDTYDVATGDPISDKTVILNSVPQLAWLGSGDYVADGTHPDTGLMNNEFVFQVSYTDVHNTAPISIQVWVDRNDDGDYLDSGEKLSMTALSGADTNYTDGKVYSKSVNFIKAGDNTLTYRFYASNGVPATGAPVTTTASTVTILNNIPTLAWAGLLNYVADGVDPNNDISGSLFDFRVKYTDDDNEAPASIQLWLDKNDNGNYNDPGEKIDMSQVDPGDSIYSDGKLYKHEINLNSAGDNNLNYRFVAGDGTDAATGTPTIDSTVGIFASTPPPDLDWTGESGYTVEGVDPDSGSGGGLYTFRVKYTQLLNTAPVTIQLWVDKNDNGDYFDSGEKIDLIAVDGADSDYSDGKFYTVATIVPYVADGSVAYMFYASDGSNDATGNAIAEQTVTVVDAVEVPSEAATIQEGINIAADGQTVLVDSGIYSENIVFPTTKSVIVQSVYGAASTTLQGDGANAPVVDISSGVHSAVLDGFTIDNQGAANTLVRGIVVDNLSAPLIKNCIIQDNHIYTYNGSGILIDNASTTKATTLLNTTVTGNAGARYGGGISCNNSKLAISNSTISSNSAARDAGGLYVTGASSTVTITDSNFNSNVAGAAYGGGGIFLDDDTTASISGGTITGVSPSPSSKYGGALFADPGGSLTISDTIISSHTTYSDGGALYLKRSATLTNVNITNNSIGIGTSGGGGAGCYVTNSSTVIMTDSRIDNNSLNNLAYSGGGIYLDTGTCADISGGSVSGNTAKNGGAVFANTGAATLTVSDTTINSNTTTAYGAGLSLNSMTGAATLTNVNFSNNNAAWNGGAIYYNSAGTALNIANSTIANNTVTNSAYDGGGIWFSGDASTTATLTGVSIIGNTARRGGGILIGTGSVVASGLDISDNVATTTNLDPGGGGVAIDTGGSFVINNSSIRGNQVGSYGGGISNKGTTTLTNCIISGNITTSIDGAGIFSTTGTLNVYNSTISGNYAKRWGGGMRLGGATTFINSIIWGNTAGDTGPNIYGTPTSVTYSDVEGGYAGTSNIDANPNFVDLQQAGLGTPTSAGDFRLCNGVDDPVAGCTNVSSCIDSASATSAPGDDMDGDSRPYDVGGLGDGVDDYDMGSDEYVP